MTDEKKLTAERKIITLGSFEGEELQWLEIFNTDRRHYLVSQYLLAGPVLEDDGVRFPFLASVAISGELERWCRGPFAKEFIPTIDGTQVYRIHAISSVEIDSILKPEEKICAPKNGEPSFWYLDSSYSNDEKHYVLVNEKGEILKENKPRYGQLYVRVGLELMTPNNPYLDRDQILATSKYNFASDWPV
jgi:hypothetical protein